MTERKITYAWNRINACKQNGFLTEALLKNYHLNLDIIRYILATYSLDYSVKDKKIKVIVDDFTEEINVNPKLKSILNKKNLKIVKPWLNKMDAYFKALKYANPYNTKSLQQESEKIFALLNISVNKLFASTR
jgi:hypothetical protein